MFYSLRGKIIHREAEMFVIECAGVGYKCLTTASTLSSLPKDGETTVFTYLAVRENAVDLFGFSSASELNSFKLLVSVSGVGPKSALSLLSEVTPEKLALCIVSGDSKTLSRAKGIGPKAAQKIILELKDKIKNEELASAVVQSGAAAVDYSAGNISEAISALVVLGYTQSEAASAVGKSDPNLSVQELIRLALKSLSGN